MSVEEITSLSMERLLARGPRPSAKASRSMASVKSENTLPEKALRRALFAAGLRFRLKAKKLPCKPDVIFPSQHLAIFVHGCFWHQHDSCSKARKPKSRIEFWTEKFRRNRDRDIRNIHSLHRMNWMPVVAWECVIVDAKRPSEIVQETKAFLQRSARSRCSAR